MKTTRKTQVIPLDGKPKRLRAITADVEKQEAVVQAFRHAWLAYERDAMGCDLYHPVSRVGSNLTDAGGIGYMVVDAIDSLILLGLDDEYQRAREWVANELSFDRDGVYSTFETTIRVLGGLLSAYELSGRDSLYLEKATELAERIMPVFDTHNGIPMTLVNLGLRQGLKVTERKGWVSTAEVSTLQLEFKYLSYLTGDRRYWDAVEKIMEVIKAARTHTGLASIFINPVDGKFGLSDIRLGSRADSYYEYLLKQYLLTNKTQKVYLDMYDDAMRGVHAHLVSRTQSNMTYTSELIPEHHSNGDVTWLLVPKQDHLVCFFPGLLMLGAAMTAPVANVSTPPRFHELSEHGRKDWLAGVRLLETCMKTHDTQTGLPPEIVHFRIASDGIDDSLTPHDWYIKGAAPGEPPPYDARYALRPEAIESLFIAFRLTGDERFRKHGWDIFQAIEAHCRVETGGYAGLLNVDASPITRLDEMETFFLSETLKYFYLLFSDPNTLPLENYVFNTEAHPLPIFHPTFQKTWLDALYI
ncbi:glycoside hydrolase [Thelephora terrestris]|uniref:alpha-1,2-Mannosidase n=1 Tax=Thelephora terrestris TaxID=56493 RepID=A0A9P6HHY0_9AGAM|nr:glycoside hydrolase [Thelephora terrestris]